METVTVLLLVLLPLAAFLIMGLFVLSRLTQSPAILVHEDELDQHEPPPRPWWGNPLLWLAVAAVFVLLGIFVAPGLFGGVLIFIPFMWIRLPRRR